MKKIAVFLALIVACCGEAALAQQSEPTPSPDPHSYSDPAMTFVAPPEAVLIQRQDVSVNQLSQDLQPVAAWAINPGKENVRIIQLAMESYLGPPEQWEAQFESQTHGSQEGTLIRNKTPMTLLNGMPATFVEVAYGAGFDARKEFAVVWADGQRGIVLSETTRIGDATTEKAQADLRQATAVRYPSYQP
jgi:hypothetical protein